LSSTTRLRFIRWIAADIGLKSMKKSLLLFLLFCSFLLFFAFFAFFCFLCVAVGASGGWRLIPDSGARWFGTATLLR